LTFSLDEARLFLSLGRFHMLPRFFAGDGKGDIEGVGNGEGKIER
jgi:hypothetical protein